MTPTGLQDKCDELCNSILATKILAKNYLELTQQIEKDEEPMIHTLGILNKSLRMKCVKSLRMKCVLEAIDKQLYLAIQDIREGTKTLNVLHN